ncbi:MAG TPA: hypothetical protein VFS33_08090 [Gemmatimonadales bacterium]|nr:hypothetical protein [Gemmatimonadales bacterium]
MTTWKWLGAGMLAAAAACASAAATKPGIKLEARLPVNFGGVSNVVELADGRVAFADTKGRIFLMADLKSGKVDTVGTRSDSLAPSGDPSHYKFPGWVAHLAGDTVALVDFATLRTTLWNERGQPLGPLPIPPLAGATPMLLYDQSGFGYKPDLTGIMGGGEPGQHALRDSTPVLRYQFSTRRVDTVAKLSPPEMGEATFGEQKQQVAKIFSPNDVFGVMPDGRVWVARARENRVDWRGPGGVWIVGKPHKYDPVPVTEKDKQNVIARIREQGRGRGLPDSLHLEWPFAEHKPAFESGIASPSGEVWLQRPRASDGVQFIYDVFGPDGSWRRAVPFPDDVMLAGFGANGAIYGIIKDGDRRTVGRFRSTE